MISPELRAEFVALLEAYVPGLQINGSQATGHVPWREDNTPSLLADLSKGVWYDRGRQEGGGVKDFKARLGLNGTSPQQARTIVTTYPYHDQHGALLYEVVRFSPKGFAQRRPDGNGGWTYNLQGVQRALYHLPELFAADPATPVLLPEGEKDTDRLWAGGFTATCNPGGAGKWRDEYNPDLAGKHVVILPDKDEPGEKHALQVARSLLPVAASIKIVRLPGLPSKGDVSDWLDAGHSKEDLAEIIKATPMLKPEDLSPEQKPQRNGLMLTSLRDLLNEPEEQVAWLVDKLLPSGGFSLLVGFVARRLW